MSALAVRLEELARAFVRELVGAVLTRPLDELATLRAEPKEAVNARTHARTRKKRARPRAAARTPKRRASRPQAGERSAPPARRRVSPLFGGRRGVDEEE